MKMSINRQNCLALLLLLLLSHAALTLHTTMHTFVDQTDCEFCSGHANPAHAIPVSAADLLSPNTFELSFHYGVRAPRVAQLTLYRERAPPIFV
jgi:hypothetical protein